MPLTQPNGAIRTAFAGAAVDIKFSGDGTRLYIAWGTKVTVYDTGSGQQLNEYELGQSVGAIDLSLDGLYLAAVIKTGTFSATHAAVDRVTLQSGAISTYDFAVGGSITGSFYDVAFEQNGRLLLSQSAYGAPSGALIELNPATGTTAAYSATTSNATLVANGDHTKIYAIDPSMFWQSRVFTVGTGFTALRTDNPDPYAGAGLPGGLNPVGAISPDQTTFLQSYGLTSAGANLNPPTRHSFLMSGDERGMVYSPSSDKIYILYGIGQVVSFDATTWEPLAVYPTSATPSSGSSNYGDGLQISADGRYLSVLGTGNVTLIDLHSVLPVGTNGNDTITESGSIIALGGNDTLDSTTGGYMFGGLGDDTYIVDSTGDQPNESAGGGYDTVILSHSSYFGVPEGIERVIVSTDAGSYVSATNSDNRIDGAGGIDTLYGWGGADTIFGFGGADLIDGGTDNDTIDGGDGSDRLIGNTGADGIIGGDGDDQIFADTYSAYSSNDDLTADIDTIIAGAGNDTVWIGVGDSADGGTGSDILNLSLAGSSAGLAIDTAALVGTAPTVLGSGTISNFEVLARLLGSDFGDSITVSHLAGAFALNAGKGDDTIRFTAVANGSASATFGTVDGGLGTDTLDLSAISPVTVGTLSTGNGQTALGFYAGAQGYILSGIETILLGSENNYVDTTAAPTGLSVDGGAGDDYFMAGVGTKSYGGEGNDTFFISRSNFFPAPSGIVAGGAGINTLQTNILFTVNLATGVASSGSTSYTLSGIQNVQVAATGGYTSTVTGDSNANVLSVNPLFDDGSVGITFRGGGGNDQLLGSLGNDSLDGGTGVNVLMGRDGNDRLIVGAGADGTVVDGGSGTDTLVVSGTVSLGSIASIEAVQLATGSNLILTGAQFANGLAPNSSIVGNGTITINIDTPIEYLFATSMTVDPAMTFVINGSSDTDVIKAANANNWINGGAGSDFIRGFNQVDHIDGGADPDKIIGAGGADILTGGGGGDQFRYFAQGDSGTGAAADHITDFTSGSDTLNFAFDSDPGTPGIQALALSYINTQGFHATGGAEVRYGTVGSDLRVEIDLDGDGFADMHIVLDGLAGQTLALGDFVGTSNAAFVSPDGGAESRTGLWAVEMAAQADIDGNGVEGMQPWHHGAASHMMTIGHFLF